MTVGGIVLGTAQFAQVPYGVTNERGCLQPDEVGRILARAEASGVRAVDTAADYEGVEAVLGDVLPSGLDVVTKVGSPGDGASLGDHVVRSVERSLSRLRRSAVDAVLLHRAADATEPSVLSALEEVRARGWCRRVGVSVYTREEIDRVLEVFRPDLVQVPLNLFDQRLVADGALADLAAEGIDVHARSVFLQGVLLAPPDGLPASLGALAAHLARCREEVEAQGMTMTQAALGFALSQPGVSAVVVGVTSEAELLQVVAALEGRAELPWEHFALDDDRYIDPRRW